MGPNGSNYSMAQLSQKKKTCRTIYSNFTLSVIASSKQFGMSVSCGIWTQITYWIKAKYFSLCKFGGYKDLKHLKITDVPAKLVEFYKGSGQN